MMLEITSAAWQFITGAADASRARGRRATASSWRTLIQENDRGNDPRVDGAPDPAEHLCHGAVPQDVHVIDVVRPGGHARDQQGIFRPGSPRPGWRS